MYPKKTSCTITLEDNHSSSESITRRDTRQERLGGSFLSARQEPKVRIKIDTSHRKYSKRNNVLYELRSWYISQLEQNGQIKYATYKSVYNFFSNGEMISNGQRLTLRKRGDLQNSFRDSNPFMVERGGYYYWAKKHANEILPTGDYAQQLNEILNSRSYRLACKLREIKNKVLLK